MQGGKGERVRLSVDLSVSPLLLGSPAPLLSWSFPLSGYSRGGLQGGLLPYWHRCRIDLVVAEFHELTYGHRIARPLVTLVVAGGFCFVGRMRGQFGGKCIEVFGTLPDGKWRMENGGGKMENGENGSPFPPSLFPFPSFTSAGR